MRLLNITATAHRDGNRIDLAWTNPSPTQPPGVRVVRSEGSHPVIPNPPPDSPAMGVVVADCVGVTTVSDVGLKGETVYYYTLFPFSGKPPTFDNLDPHNQTSATAISQYDFAGQLYAILPAIYRRYDAQRLPAPDSVKPADQDKGELRRFLDLPGGELDRLYSLTRAALALANLDRVDGRLLPLLAQWIGWPTNYRLPVNAQRNEIRFAPRIYQTIGSVPALDATVARVTGWTSKTKEFVHNVARTNQPERLNLWSTLRDTGEVTWPPQTLASVNFAYDGRPAVVREADGSTLFYHTYRQHGWDIWAKRFTPAGWQPSQPVVDRPSIDKHPTAAVQGDKLWLFWQSYDPAQPPEDRKWQIWFATRTGTTWSAPAVFGDAATERWLPAAVADNAGGLWLFWLELVAGSWQLRYNRHKGQGWQLDTPQTLPLDAGQPPRVEDDLFVLFHPTSTNQRLWLFWARQEPPGAAGQTRWRVVYRIKQDLDPAMADWSQIRALPATGSGGYHDRQPAALLTTNGDIELFWSSTQPGGWSIVHNTLAIGLLTWGTSQQVRPSPYTQRAPLPVPVETGTLLVYRSNESLAYTSSTFGATHTLDHRYAGTTTVDTGAVTKMLPLRGTFEDFQTYTYDAGTGGVRTNHNRIARDTVGLYLAPPSASTDSDDVQVEAMVSRLASELAAFMPVTTRAVFIRP
jgi:hypothetical protein